ncbi:MAG: hypothetical protein ACLUJG_01880 [Lawsonibacter sp.]
MTCLGSPSTACATPLPPLPPSGACPSSDIGKALGPPPHATTGRIYTHLIDRTHEETLMRVSDALK